MMEKPRAIIVSNRGPASNWLGTARSLGKEGIRVIRLAPDDWSNSKYCTSVISPYVDKKREFLGSLLKLGKQRTVKDVLFPTTDESLILISKSKERLKVYFEPVASDWETVQKVIDKRETYDFAKKLRIPVPDSFIPKNISEAKRIAEEMSYPCLLKPVYSHIFCRRFCTTKLFEVSSKKELIEKYKVISGAGHELLVQEKIPGKDDQVYELGAVFNKNSEPLAIFLGRKLRQFPPRFGVGSFTESVWNPKVVDLGIRLLKGMKFYGVAAVEFKKDHRTGDFRLLDINGRSWSWNSLATFCGLNLPYIAYKDAVGEEPKPLSNYSCDYRLGRKWVHLRLDFLSMIKMRKEGNITFSKWLSTLLPRKKTFGIFSMHDPLPFFHEVFLQIKSCAYQVYKRRHGIMTPYMIETYEGL